MQTSVDYQCGNNTIILFATQYKIDNTAFHRRSAVSGSLALLRTFCQWKIEHQVRAVWKAWYWGTWLGAKQVQAIGMKAITTCNLQALA